MATVPIIATIDVDDAAEKFAELIAMRNAQFDEQSELWEQVAASIGGAKVQLAQTPGAIAGNVGSDFILRAHRALIG